MNFEKQALRNLEHMTKSETVHPANRDLIDSYYRYLCLSGISAAQRQKLTAHLRIIFDHAGGKPFKRLKKRDIEDIVAWLYTRGTAESTVNDYKQVIKQFWKWMHDGEDPPETKWIQTRGPTSRRLLPQSLLTPYDVEALIETCTSERDRAFIAILWETGARIGELIDLKVGDIEDNITSNYVIVSGKTGARRLLLLESSSYITDWLAIHPNPDSDAFLWAKYDVNASGQVEQISYQHIRTNILEKARERANIQKPVNPHHFRHSRATYLANHLTEAQMCEWFGWARGSRVPGRYVHLSGRDIDTAYLRMVESEQYHRLAG